MVLRYLGLVLVLGSIPLFRDWMSGPVAQRRVGWFAIGLMPFVVPNLHLNFSFISWAMWPGYVKGATVTLLETLALAVVLTERERIPGRPLLWAYLVFMAASALPTVMARPMQASLFFSWQLACSTLVFVAVSKIAMRPEAIRTVIGGLATACCLEAALCVWQRLHGLKQATGTMIHQNLLGLCLHFALFLCLASILAGDRRVLIKAGVAGALIAVALTASRATEALAAAGVMTLLILSATRRLTAAKVRVVAVGVLALLVAVPVGYLSVQNRFGGGSIMSAETERMAFERAARAMWHDHPFGVGANQYVVRANIDGYSSRAGVIWEWGSRSANVHNVYLLLGAETGWLGLGAFFLLLGAALWRAFQLAWARPRGLEGELALGAGIAVLVVALHSRYEWAFVTWGPQSLFAITLGIISGLAKQRRLAGLERQRSAPRRADRPAVPAWPEPVPA